MKLVLLTILLSLATVSSIRGDRMPRLVGGKSAKSGQFNFIAMILYMESFICTGSIITPIWVLTANHCIVNTKHPWQMRVSAGGVTWPRGLDAQVRHVVRAFKYIPSRKELEVSNILQIYIKIDVGLLKLIAPFQLTPTLGLAPPPKSFIWPRGHRQNCTLIGWGPVSNDKKQDDVVKLSFHHMLVGDISYCAYRSLRLPVKWLLCSVITGFEGGRLGMACTGDSGGAVYCWNNALVGVISGKLFSRRNMNNTNSSCVEFYPNDYVYDVYMFTNYFWKWVEQKTGDLNAPYTESLRPYIYEFT